MANHATQENDVEMLSFIVPAHNEEASLGFALESIAASARSLDIPFEMIVVDDASTDATAQIAAEAGARVVSVDLRQIATVRNAGAEQAEGDVLVFLDADTVLPEATLRAALAALGEGAVGGGAQLSFDEGTPFWGRYMLWLWNLGSRLTRWAAGCFIFVRRQAFEAVDGFDPQYYAGEELYLSRALKRQGRFVILRQRVVTSGRQTRKHSAWKLLWIFMRLILTGPRSLRSRKGLDMWYERSDL